MKNEADIGLDGKKLVIASAKSPRADWFEGYKPEVDSEPLAAVPVNEKSEE